MADHAAEHAAGQRQATRQRSAVRHYGRFLRRHGWLIVLVPVLAVGVALWTTKREKPLYRASMDILVAQAGGRFQPQVGSLPLTQTMMNILTSDVIAQRVVDELHLQPMTSSDLLAGLKVGVKPDSSVINVTYDSHKKAKTVEVLAGVSSAFKELIREQLGVTGTLSKPGPFQLVATVFNPPHVEAQPVSPKPKKTGEIALLLGLAIGLVLAFARESLDNRIRGARDAEEWFGAAVIGALPKGLRRIVPAALAGKRPRRSGDLVKALQLLRANVQFSQAANGGRAVLVTAPTADDGKSAVAGSLAASLAMAGTDVICVEADTRRPGLRRWLEVKPDAPGLVDVLAGTARADDALQEVSLSVDASATGHPRLRVLPAGDASGAGHVSAERVRELVNELSAQADYVILDGPPLLDAAEAFPLVLGVRSVLVVARQGRTTRESAEAVRSTLEGLGSRRVSVVLTESGATVGAGS